MTNTFLSFNFEDYINTFNLFFGVNSMKGAK